MYISVKNSLDSVRLFTLDCLSSFEWLTVEANDSQPMRVVVSRTTTNSAQRGYHILVSSVPGFASYESRVQLTKEAS
jgi:hypothetical protein